MKISTLIILVYWEISLGICLFTLPKTNVWITLANITGLESLCLATATPQNPFSTCLVGIPADQWPVPTILKPITYGTGLVDNWDGWVPYLPLASLEPQELELLGSIKADYCLKFDYTGKNHTIAWNASPIHEVFKNESQWCNYTSKIISKSTNRPLKLPPGFFLICGDRAWPAIPSHIRGGPCTIGRLTVSTPSDTTVLRWRKKYTIHTFQRKKRALHTFASDCKDNIEFWNRSEITALGIFAPSVAAVQALVTLNKIGCWLAKQTNATSLALSGLLADVDSVRHASLQNRAATDFLLLAQGRGCEDFEGMCCMNLSDHSESIHASIQRLQDGVRKLQIEDNWDWFDKLLGGWGLTGWLRSMLKTVCYVLIVIFIILLLLPCIFRCIQRMIDKATANVFLVQQKGGIVDSRASSSEQLLTLEQLQHKPWWGKGARQHIPSRKET